MFHRVDPFTLFISLPVVIPLLCVAFAMLVFLGGMSVISGAFAIHPPLATWLLDILSTPDEDPHE